MIFKVGTLLNDGEGRFWRYEESDRLVPGPTVTVEASDTDAALNVAWEIGNRMGSDVNDETWPDNLRSLSAGDVLAVATETASGKAFNCFAIEGVGFKVVSERAILHSTLMGLISTRGPSLPRPGLDVERYRAPDLRTG